MGDAHELNEGFGRRNLFSVSFASQGVTHDHLGARRKLALGTGADQTSDFMTSFEQGCDKRTAQIASASRDKYAVLLLTH